MITGTPTYLQALTALTSSPRQTQWKTANSDTWMLRTGPASAKASFAMSKLSSPATFNICLTNYHKSVCCYNGIQRRTASNCNIPGSLFRLSDKGHGVHVVSCAAAPAIFSHHLSEASMARPGRPLQVATSLGNPVPNTFINQAEPSKHGPGGLNFSGVAGWPSLEPHHVAICSSKVFLPKNSLRERSRLISTAQSWVYGSLASWV